MAVDKRVAITQMWAVINGYGVAQRRQPDGTEQIEGTEVRRLMTRALATIDRLAPAGSAYARQADEITQSDGGDAWKTEQLVGVIAALREDYEQDAMQSVLELAHSDLFDDFLEMSTELHTKGFVGPAAVLAGSVLEEHLRKLAAKHNVGVRDERGRPKSVEVLGVDLRNAGAFNEVQRKTLTAWYAQRTDAAHGHFDQLVAPEVERMIAGIRDFIARLPA